MQIANATLEDYTLWYAGMTLGTYVRRMEGSAWGGAIELAAFSQMRQTSVYVYEKSGTGFKRIADFHRTGAMQAVHLLYQGRSHYDLLLL